MKEDNQDIQMLKEELWIQWTTNQGGMPIVLLRKEHLQIIEEGIQERIKKSKQENKK